VSRNLIIRTSVAAVTIPVILWICYQGGYWLFGMVTLFAGVALLEFLINEGYSTRNVSFWLAWLTVIGCLVAASLAIPPSSDHSMTPNSSSFLSYTMSVLLAFFLLSAMAKSIGKEPPPELFRKHSRLFWGVAYIGMLYPFVYAIGYDGRVQQLAKAASGGDLLLFLFGLLWVGDTAAMGFGKWLGKHKLAPAVSPNKTVEGFIGGLIGSLAIGLLMAFWKFRLLPIHHVLLIALGCSLFGQLGDLVESMWKRSLGLKDSSDLIPGHGGVLDRFDSLLFAAPFMYGYLIWVVG
jgi:phosphatidate cytidylyltransferase